MEAFIRERTGVTTVWHVTVGGSKTAEPFKDVKKAEAYAIQVSMKNKGKFVYVMPDNPPKDSKQNKG